MKKNIDLVIDGIAPEKVMYDTDNHSLVVLYPAQREFKRGDKVRLKKSLNLKVGEYYNGMCYLKSMDDVKDAVLTVEGIPTYDTLGCINNIDNDFWCYHKEWLEHIVEDEVKFKRGDIVVHDNTKRVSIFDSYENKHSRFNAIFSIDRRGDIDYNESWVTDTVRYATSSEIEKFDNDLKEIGKKWNRETLQLEDLDIPEIAVDLESACEYLNKPMPKNYVYEPNSDFEKQINAQIELQMIREAWNKFDGFVADWNDIEQEKHAPYRYAGSGDFDAVNSSNWLGFESLIVFKSTERASQFGNQFKELFKTAMGL